MTAPKWAAALLRRLSPPERADDVVGDLEESHRRRCASRGRLAASVVTAIDALDMASALVRERVRGRSRKLGSAFSWLDIRLGLRMLVKYPGLTMVGGFAIAFAIWVGAGVFEGVIQLVYPRLPLDEGDRIVGIRLWHTPTVSVEEQALYDFVGWRESVKSVEDLGAFRTLQRNLTAGDGRAEPIEVVEISASVFRVARVPPLLGRSLIDADEQAGAPAVVVIGHDLWQRRFAGDPDIVGKSVRLGSSQATVVGVMPEGFAFPISHSLWVPLRLDVIEYGRRQGPAVNVFGRLAPGKTLAEAQTELAALGRRTAADYPDTHEHIRPEVLPYAKSILNIPDTVSLGIMSSNLLFVMLLLLICANVALLMFARAATRESEIVVRAALGASRGRIVMQLFVEALVLGVVGAIGGLGAAGFGLKWMFGIAALMVEEPIPFWFHSSLSLATVLYTGVLTVLGAAVAGVLPALKVTRGIGAQLRQATAGGGGLRFGGIWTAVIVSQVAITVVFPAVAFFVRRDAVQVQTHDVGFADDEYLSVRVEMDRENASGALTDSSRAAFVARFGSKFDELRRRLGAEPTVLGVTFADKLPRMYHAWNQIAVDEGAVEALDERGHRVASVSVDPNYFEVLGTPILSGRGFHSSDVASGARVAIVNQPFVEKVLGGRNPVGRWVRYLASEASREPRHDGPWYEIVGVVRDIGTKSGWGLAGIYHPMTERAVADYSARMVNYPLYLAVHVKGDPLSFVQRLRTVAASVEPTLRLHAVQPLNHVVDGDLRFYRFWFRLTALMSAIALLLSLAGIYAVMAFTVARRTREIGVRVALGADARLVALTIFRRPLAQIALGVLVGGALTTAISFGSESDIWPRGAVLAFAYALIMTAVCMLACIVPTRRALRIEPTEALRTDG